MAVLLLRVKQIIMNNIVIVAARESANRTGNYNEYLSLLKSRAEGSIQPELVRCIDLHEITTQKKLSRILKKTKNPTTRLRIEKEISEFTMNRCSLIEELLELSFTNKEKDESYYTLFKEH